MNNSESDKAAMKVVLPAYNKNEFIMILQKVLNDFYMLDSKMKEILNSNNIDIESMGNVADKLNEANRELNKYAELRNKIIEELIIIIKK